MVSGTHNAHGARETLVGLLSIRIAVRWVL